MPTQAMLKTHLHEAGHDSEYMGLQETGEHGLSLQAQQIYIYESVQLPHPPYLIPRCRNDGENPMIVLGILSHPKHAALTPLLCKF